jgi:hypothetical protein
MAGQVQIWGNACRRCPERTGHKLKCCGIALCMSCQDKMESRFHPFVYCPWCNVEILPLEVQQAQQRVNKYLLKLAELQQELVGANLVLENFHKDRAEYYIKHKSKN